MRCVELNKRTLASENFQDFPSNLILFLYLFPASYSFQFIFIFSFMSLFFNLVLSILTSLPMILQYVFLHIVYKDQKQCLISLEEELQVLVRLYECQ